jgi:2-(1,2-epoxy-1,2-dihydrophenyl)acetyl-CoA isomerase
MINRCVPDSELLATAKKLATELANGPASVAMIRKIGWASLDNDWKEQLHLERVTQRDAGRTEDFLEGVTAFLQKRPAQFKGS